MEKLTAITLSSDKTFASVDPGARWGDVYTALDSEKAVVIGGRLPQVGVAGLILGGLYLYNRRKEKNTFSNFVAGGYFHISGEFGLAADNVKNFEVMKQLTTSHFIFVDYLTSTIACLVKWNHC